MRRARVGAAFGHSLPWAIAVVYFFAAPSDLDFGTQVMIWILFAMSLDLALGYAGILTLGQAAFFGLGAYTAGLFAIHLSPDPLLGHLAAIGVTALVAALTGAMILHTSGVTLLMLTLAIDADPGD
jgi:branched-chain amino acid transport system permease protein